MTKDEATFLAKFLETRVNPRQTIEIQETWDSTFQVVIS